MLRYGDKIPARLLRHRAHVAVVTLQVAIHVIEDWLQRISSDKHPQLPEFNRQAENAADPLTVLRKQGPASFCGDEAASPAEPLFWAVSLLARRRADFPRDESPGANYSARILSRAF